MAVKKRMKLSKKLIVSGEKALKSKEKILLPFRKYLFITIVINILLIAVSFLIQQWLPPEIPLFYGQVQGSKQLAPSLGIAIPALVSLVILSINLLISQLVAADFLKKILIITAISLSLLSLITTLKIIFLVGSFS